MSQSEFDIAVELIQTCGMTIPGIDPRKFTVVANPNQLDGLKGFLSVWKDDGLLDIDATNYPSMLTRASVWLARSRR